MSNPVADAFYDLALRSEESLQKIAIAQERMAAAFERIAELLDPAVRGKLENAYNSERLQAMGIRTAAPADAEPARPNSATEATARR